jgi:hypothetical protein
MPIFIDIPSPCDGALVSLASFALPLIRPLRGHLLSVEEKS